MGRVDGCCFQCFQVGHAALLHHSLEPLYHSSGLGRLAWQVVAGDDARRIADIVQICNLLDEQLEALEFEYKEVETILGEIQSFAPLGGFDPALVEHLRDMRCREFSGQLQLPVEAGAARLVFRTLSAPREYEIRELEAIALRDPVLAGSLLGEISLPKLAVIWSIQILLPAVLLGLALWEIALRVLAGDRAE